ncbi:MAG TPA: HEAT repeat domain-containing protein [Nannocystis sp.]|jgi:HEAT repeat protein
MRSALLLALAVLACGAPPANEGPAPATNEQATADDLAATLARIASAPEAVDRRPLMQQIHRAPAELALPALRAGLADPDPAIRTAAAHATGRRRDGKALASELIALATGDAVPAVRAAGCRGLGQLRLPGAFVPLQQNLSHETAEVRLAALRALARIDAARAAALPELGRLQLDPDARVAGAATKISRGVDLQ